MRPARNRIGKGVHALIVAQASGLLATPALATPTLAAGFPTNTLTGAMPMTITMGAVAFGVAASLMAWRYRQRSEAVELSTHDELLGLRTALDEFEAVLTGLPEVTIIWHGPKAEPRVYGQVTEVLPGPAMATTILDFARWLPESEAAGLAHRLAELRVQGKGFDLSLSTNSGEVVRATGRVFGVAAVLRLRRARAQPRDFESTVRPVEMADISGAKAILGLLSKPAWVRDPDGRIIYANPAYLHLARSLGKVFHAGDVGEIIEPTTRDRNLDALTRSQDQAILDHVRVGEQAYDMVIFAIEGGTAGYLRPQANALDNTEQTNLGNLAAIIDALATPVAVFDARRQLVHFNRAYASLWDLDPDWLNTGPDERAILDHLRTQDQLPSEPDYRAWRANHLTAYTLSTPREDVWYLPDGRTLNVIAAPASANGGVIYVFEDITERLALESRYNALIHVQRETLNALSEAVAVFGTNGRLKLSNPQLSSMWKLPMNDLGRNPHIDHIAEACGRVLPEDGERIWSELKRSIIDLDPNRADTSGRLTRADGRLIDYAIVRLPDGQSLMTFVDVTEGANYQRVLKERNEALITADRLKDAFIQNVSYEFRSPLTNIIGFADLLASGEAGDLNERQRAYADYIRASSTSLGVLIDNILDLATVDAGIAELDVRQQDIPTLIEKARAGVATAFAGTGDEDAVNLVVQMDEDLPAFYADGTRIVQVLYNLLSNAARFSEPGADVRLKVSGRGDRITFTVEDDGVGIADEMKTAAFQRFEGQSVEGRQRGAGLGLAIVKTFVNLHGGTVSIERREPRGTRVTVSLPTEPVQTIQVAE